MRFIIFTIVLGNSAQLPVIIHNRLCFHINRNIYTRNAYVCVYTYIHTYMNTRIHTLHTYIHTHISTHIRTDITYIHTYIYNIEFQSMDPELVKFTVGCGISDGNAKHIRGCSVQLKLSHENTHRVI
jgi:hypothetical protein